LNAIVMAFAIAFGLAVGSFLNVVILRLPAGGSLWGRSRCPHCKQALGPLDLLPVLSFVALLGRCRRCRASISWRYPAIELVTAALAVATVARFGVGPEAIVNFLFGAALIVVTVIDYDHQIIPDVITLPGVALALLARSLLGGDWLAGLAGAAGGAAGLWLVALAYRLVARREGLGFGDVKLAALLGAFLGGSGVFLTIFLASILGSFAGIALILSGRGDRSTALPFGSFLAPVGVLVLFYGPAILRWYALRCGLGG
jgi:leader peptidase (prepilin peptidase)/N-methyltransferase